MARRVQRGRIISIRLNYSLRTLPARENSGSSAHTLRKMHARAIFFDLELTRRSIHFFPRPNENLYGFWTYNVSSNCFQFQFLAHVRISSIPFAHKMHTWIRPSSTSLNKYIFLPFLWIHSFIAARNVHRYLVHPRWIISSIYIDKRLRKMQILRRKAYRDTRPAGALNYG